MALIKCFQIIDGKEVFVMDRDENKFTAKRVESGEDYIIKGKRGKEWKYTKYDEKAEKAIIEAIE